MATPQKRKKVHIFGGQQFLEKCRCKNFSDTFRVAMPAEVRCEVSWWDSIRNLKSLMYLAEFWGKTFRPARKAPNISGRISGQILAKFSRNFVSNFASFFGNAVQQKGGVKTRVGSFLESFFAFFQTLFRIKLRIFRGQFRSADVPPQWFPRGPGEAS